MITNIITAIITAYTWTGNPCSNGQYPTIHHTVAIPRSLPLGTKVQIDGIWYSGEDRTAIKYDGRFDIFVSSKQEALKWGKQRKKVKIVYESIQVDRHK